MKLHGSVTVIISQLFQDTRVGMMAKWYMWAAVALALLMPGRVGAEALGQGSAPEAITVRNFVPEANGDWIGEGVSYGPFREGQRPGGEQPTEQQLTEDLVLIAKHWRLIRMYGTQGCTENVLRIIRDQELPIKVMLGAWITREYEGDGQASINQEAVRANRREVEELIRLTNAYPDVVIAASVGNETQVYWSAHVTRTDVLVKYIRQVRSATKIPVTTADDFNFWNKPQSQAVAAEVDFLVLHVHALWAGNLLKDAIGWTERIYDEICDYHPTKLVVIGEAGWATQVHTEGEQAKLIKGKAGEKEQAIYYQQFTDWARKEKICTFFFEAFDEPWKGGPHPNEVEKHWGLFKVNRQPKEAMKSLAK